MVPPVRLPFLRAKSIKTTQGLLKVADLPAIFMDLYSCTNLYARSIIFHETETYKHYKIRENP